MIYLKTEEQIELLREANLIVARTLGEVAKWIKPGVTTLKLDQIAEEYIRSQGAVPGFLGLYGFPNTLCISINENVVHGIPSNYALEEGDIVSIDCGAVIAVGFILKHFGDPQPFKDSTTTVLSIVAQALMALAFMEQWALWIITNIVSVVMWCICVARGEAHAAVMVIMWTFYLLNSINGFRVWLKLSR